MSDSSVAKSLKSEQSVALDDSIQEHTADDITKDEEMLDQIEEVQEEEEQIEDRPYSPPPVNYVYILDKDSQAVLVNPSCRKGIFLDFVRQKLDVAKASLEEILKEEAARLTKAQAATKRADAIAAAKANEDEQVEDQDTGNKKKEKKK